MTSDETLNPGDKEAATATEEPPSGGIEQGDSPASGRRPISISADLLTAEAKERIQKERKKARVDIPHEVLSEESRPHSVKAVNFKVSAEDFAAEITRYYNELRGEITLPGFRKGKAPVKLIRIRMGEEADRDTMTEVAADVLRQFVLSREVKIVDEPRITDWTIKEGEPLLFTAEMEVRPTIELKQYKGLSVKVGTQKVDDETVEDALQDRRNRAATWEAAPADATVSDDSAIVIDLKVTGEDGQELRGDSRENWFVQDFKEALPPELAEKVIGLKAGGEVSAAVKTTRTNRRGDALEFTDNWALTVREIKVKNLPALDDEFAKDVSEHETLDALRDEIRKGLTERMEAREKEASVVEISKALIAANPFEAPKSMIRDSQAHAIQRQSVELSRYGIRLSDLVADPGAFLASQEAAAEFRVKQAYLFHEIATAEKLEVTDEEFEAEIKSMAEKSGRKPLAVRASLEANKQTEELRHGLLDRKITEFLLSNNTVEKVEGLETETPETEEE